MRDGSSRILRRLIPAAALFLAGCAGEYPQTMLRPVSDFGRIQTDLWGTVTWWTAGIMFVVFAALLYIIIRFRGQPGDPTPEPVYGHTGLEIAWTIAPAIIIVFIAIPSIQAIFETQTEAPDDALVVEAIGHQWWWEFHYPEQGVTTANQFYIPRGRTVDLQLRSADVIHSFWVPRFGGKRDVNPVVTTPEGMEPLHLNNIVVSIDSAGDYLGQCAEYCGTSHAIMRMMARVVEQDDFDRWIEDIQDPMEPVGELERRGRDIFLSSSCVACHTIAGTSAQATQGPNLTLMGERFSIGAGLMDNTEENLTEWILRAPELKHGALMPGAEVGAGGVPPTGLSREDARAIAAYLTDMRRPVAGIRPVATVDAEPAEAADGQQEDAADDEAPSADADTLNDAAAPGGP